MGVILVAYERESEQSAVEQLLLNRGHQVTKVANGLSALDSARREPPHLIVSDIVLPRMDGFALCRKWKQDERLQSIPFIFYTRRHDDPKYERFALELGAERFFARTSPSESLVAAVDELLANVPVTKAAARTAAVDEAVAQRAQTQALIQQKNEAHALALAALKAEHTAALERAQQAHAQMLERNEQEHAQAVERAQQAGAQTAERAQHMSTQAVERAQHVHEQALEQAQQTHSRLRVQLEELTASQERLAAGEARFRRVFEANPVPMWLADHATRGFIAVNEAALALYGYTRGEFLGLTTRNLEGAASSALDAEGPDVVAHKNKRGEPLWVTLAAQQIEFDGRNADLVSAHDLTQRIARAQDKSSGAAASEVVDSLGDGYLALDSEQRIVEANAAYCRMSGYTRDELLKLTLGDIEQSGVGDTTARLQFVKMDGANRHETRHKRADGSLVDVEISVGPFANENHGNTTMLVRDVTRRRRERASQRGGQRQLEFLIDLYKHADASDEAGIVRRVIEQATEATGSPLAYLYFVDPAQKTATLAAWRDRGQAHATLPNADARALSKGGVFTECIRARHATSSNDLNWKPQTDGLPDLQRFLAVPMVTDEQTVAILGVANRDASYGEDDQRLLGAIADGVWRILQAKRAHARTLSSLQRSDVALQGMIEALVRIGEQHDPYTAGSSRRVAALAVALAREAGLAGERQHVLRVAALLHDVGNVAVPAALLAKPSALTAAEVALMRTHAEEGCKLLAEIDFGAPVAEIVFEHHERFDGSGYPRGLKGDAISIEARILAIADTVEAMCSPRPHRGPLGMDAAIEELNRGAGKQFDLQLVTACTRLIRQRGFVLPD